MSGVCVCLSFNVCSIAECTVNLQEELGPLEPLFIKDNQLWAPEGPELSWEAGESTLVACSKVKLNNS